MKILKPFITAGFIFLYFISCSYVADVYIENTLTNEIKVTVTEWNDSTNTFFIQPNEKKIVTGYYSDEDFVKQILIYTNNILIYSNDRNGFLQDIQATQLVEQEGCFMLPDPEEYIYTVK